VIIEDEDLYQYIWIRTQKKNMFSFFNKQKRISSMIYRLNCDAVTKPERSRSKSWKNSVTRRPNAIVLTRIFSSANRIIVWASEEVAADVEVYAFTLLKTKDSESLFFFYKFSKRFIIVITYTDRTFLVERFYR